MKQGDIVAAYKTLSVLNRKPGLPFGVIQKLFLKKKELEPYWQMQGEQETILIEATGQKVEDYELTPEIKKGLLEQEYKMTTKKTLRILLYGNFLPKTKKDKWSEILLGEFDFLDDILNVAQCPANIYENNLIYIHDE